MLYWMPVSACCPHLFSSVDLTSVLSQAQQLDVAPASPPVGCSAVSCTSGGGQVQPLDVAPAGDWGVPSCILYQVQPLDMAPADHWGVPEARLQVGAGMLCSVHSRYTVGGGRLPPSLATAQRACLSGIIWRSSFSCALGGNRKNQRKAAHIQSGRTRGVSVFGNFRLNNASAGCRTYRKEAKNLGISNFRDTDAVAATWVAVKYVWPTAGVWLPPMPHLRAEILENSTARFVSMCRAVQKLSPLTPQWRGASVDALWRLC
jgi:hypothetical protein